MSITAPTREVPWAGSAAGDDIAEPADGQKDTGWTLSQAELVAPPYQWFNWLLNRLFAWVKYLRVRGLPDYFTDAAYSPGDRCQVSGVGWKRIGAGDTTDVAPGSDATKWIQCGRDDAQLSDLADDALNYQAASLSTTNSASYSNEQLYQLGSWLAGGHQVTVLSFLLQLDAGSNSTVVTVAGGAALFPANYRSIQVTPQGTGSVSFNLNSVGAAGANLTLAINQGGGVGGACWVRVEGIRLIS
jgi:hypothetical protein